jgi:hypothetical protein
MRRRLREPCKITSTSENRSRVARMLERFMYLPCPLHNLLPLDRFWEDGPHW